jgi:uncharacterized paraquat-inducible protein A
VQRNVRKQGHNTAFRFPLLGGAAVLHSQLVSGGSHGVNTPQLHAMHSSPLLLLRIKTVLKFYCLSVERQRSSANANTAATRLVSEGYQFEQTILIGLVLFVPALFITINPLNPSGHYMYRQV